MSRPRSASNLALSFTSDKPLGLQRCGWNIPINRLLFVSENHLIRLRYRHPSPPTFSHVPPTSLALPSVLTSLSRGQHFQSSDIGRFQPCISPSLSPCRPGARSFIVPSMRRPCLPILARSRNGLPMGQSILSFLSTVSHWAIEAASVALRLL